MFKLANQILDQYDDTGRENLVKLARINPKIYLMSPEEHAKIASDEFALSVITKKAALLNKFPVNDHDNTWLSNHYFDMNHHKLSEKAASIAAYHIKQACSKFVIEPKPSVAALAKEASSNIYYEEERSMQKIAKVVEADLTKFAEVQQIGDNYTVAQYTFSSSKHIKIAAKYFEEYHKEMPVEYRHKYAAAIQKRANELGLPPVKGTVSKYASDHYSGHLDAHILSRKGLLEISNPDYAEALQKLSAMKTQMQPDQFAKILHGIDKRAGLDKYYGGYLTDPFQATFGLAPNPYSGWTAKTASGSMTADEVTKVATEKYAKIKEYFGVNVADELKKHGAPIFESLPKDAQEAIVGIANGSL